MRHCIRLARQNTMKLTSTLISAGAILGLCSVSSTAMAQQCKQWVTEQVITGYQTIQEPYQDCTTNAKGVQTCVTRYRSVSRPVYGTRNRCVRY